MNDAKREDDGPYEQAPEQEEVAGFFDGMAQGRALMLRRLRTALAPLGLTVNRRATLVAISDAEPIPETVGKPADNPFQNPHYDFGYRCGLVAANQVFAPAARELPSHLAMSMADDGTVSVSAKTPSLAAAFISQKRELVAPPSINTPAADRILTLFANREARAAFTKKSSTPSRRALVIGAAVAVLLSAGLGIFALRAGQASDHRHPVAQAFTERPAETWNIFPAARRTTYAAIDQWIINRYQVGAFTEVADVINAVMSSAGNDEAKNYASLYAWRARRWELTPALLVGLDPGLSRATARNNILYAVFSAVRYSGAQFFSSSHRAFLQNYLSSAVETDLPCVEYLQDTIALMIQSGL